METALPNKSSISSLVPSPVETGTEDKYADALGSAVV